MNILHSARTEAGTYVEWRVTGIPDTDHEPYSFVWSELLNDHLGDAETAAKAFATMLKEAPGKWPGVRHAWVEGPHLSTRTVTISEWADADAG